MTLFPPPALDTTRRRWWSLWIGVLITSACVAAGAAVVLSTQQSVEKPAAVAKAYLEARCAGNWPQAWALVCTRTRWFVGDYTSFVANAVHWDEPLSLPRHFEVAVGDIHAAAQPGGFSTVTAMVTSAERKDWSITGEVPLVVEDGRFRVCDGALALG